MKHKNNPNETHNIPDLDIIDLDTADLGSSDPDAEYSDISDLYTDTAYEEQEDSPEEPSRKKRSSTKYLHLAFVLALLLIIGLVFWRIWNYGTLKDLDDYESEYVPEVLDNIVPLLTDEDVTITDDGKTTIVAFGNAPFADDRDAKDSVLNLIAAQTGATIYNCSVGGSYLAAEGATLSSEIAPLDAFNFYWLTTAFCLRNNGHVYQQIFDTLGDDAPEDGIKAYETLMDIDFNTVDVIVLMYDGSDYLAGHYMYTDANDTDIQHFTGNMCAGIDLIQETFPHIRIIVMSPTYAFALNEEGQQVSSDQYRYNGQDVLSTYVIKQSDFAYDRGVSFVDNLYGTINEDDAPKYLTDHLHLNAEGRKLVADRFVYALNYFDQNKEE